MSNPRNDRRPETENRQGPGEPSGNELQPQSQNDLRRGPRVLTLRAQRLKLAWLLAIPFLFFARPSPESLASGGVLSVLGLLVRGVAAGSIHKDQELARGGLYGHLRHPLYLGSFLVGTGVSTASGVWWVLPVFVALFAWMYGRVIVEEERGLKLRFGAQYRDYREQVPAFTPGSSDGPSRPPAPGSALASISETRNGKPHWV